MFPSKVEGNINGDSPWFTSTWRDFPVSQQVEYPSEEELIEVLDTLKAQPSIVHPSEVDALSQELADCASGKKIYLQCGDCAERFSDCKPEIVASKIKLIHTMSALITQITGKPVVRIGRIAGQYGKPRTSPFEVLNGAKIHAFKGDNVNGINANERVPDPKRLIQGYANSAATMGMIKKTIANNEVSNSSSIDFVEEKRDNGRSSSNVYLRAKAS